MINRKDFFRAGCYYLIHNYGNGGEHIFKDENDMHYFMKKHHEYMNLHFQIIAWSLVPEEFYFVVKVRSQEDNLSWNERNLYIRKDFSAFVSGFAKRTNKKYNRRGSLFARNFKRVLLRDEAEIRNAICTIHFKPVSQNLIADPSDWRFSSCRKLNLYSYDHHRSELIAFFGSEENFINEHLRFRTSLLAA